MEWENIEKEVLSKLEEEEKAMETQYPPTWEFKKEGEVLVGKVVDIKRGIQTTVGERDALIIETKDGVYTLWLSHKVLAEEIKRKDVKAGDVIGIKYLGKPEKKRYYTYIVVKV